MIQPTIIYSSALQLVTRIYQRTGVQTLYVLNLRDQL